MVARQTERERESARESEISRQAGRGGLGSRPECGVVGRWAWKAERCGVELYLNASEWVMEGRPRCWVPRWDSRRRRRCCRRRQPGPSSRLVKEGAKRERRTDKGERQGGKVWTMTQGREPHGDGEGREELLIRACGISCSYHRTDSVPPSWPLLSRRPPAISPSGTGSTRITFSVQELGKRVSWGSKWHKKAPPPLMGD